jgi:glycosyltransferase involved in cell wall biosynthesis
MRTKQRKIILDCDLMRHRDSGLFHYCRNLGNYASRRFASNPELSYGLYIPPGAKTDFEPGTRQFQERKWHHRFVNPALFNCNIWHAPFQSGRILPPVNSRTKIVLTIHDLNCLHEDKTAKERERSLQHTQSLVDRSDVLICISQHCRKDVLENLDTGKKTVHVIYNGTHQVCEPPPQPSRYKPNRPFLFTMGYVNRKKNFHSLLPILENNDLELIVAGRLDEPDYIEQMRRKAEELQVDDRLRILGPVPEEDKAWYLNNCMAFALPSLAEGFGAPVVEAMKFGKPLFLSHRTSLPEIGKDVAFYFHSFEPEHMQQVFRESMTEYNKNGLAGRIRKRGSEFNWEEKVEEYCRVYESLL